MYTHKPLATGLALGLAWGLTYLLCALVTSVFPTLLADALGVLVHGLNVDAFRAPVPTMATRHVVIGAIFFTFAGAWLGAVYAVLANALKVLRVPG